MIKIVALHGTGDVYLLAALFDAFRRWHNRDAELITKQKYGCIADMFGVPWSADDKLIAEAELNGAMQRDYENALINDRYFFAHPSFWRTNMRVDHLTTKTDVSQADMYKIILRIPPDTPLTLAKVPEVETERGKVVIIPDARSWPNLYPTFWEKLSNRLAHNWNVKNNRVMNWSLAELLRQCASAEWVIGPQCGVMSILVTGRFPCRKTLATPAVDDNPAFRFSQRTFPYGYVTKFSNQDYDVEEFKIAADTHDDLIEAIVSGQNALRLWPHDPSPTASVMVPLMPGDFLDRLAVLTVKYAKFPPERRAAIMREYQRHTDLRDAQKYGPEIDRLFDELIEIHSTSYDLLQRIVPAALDAEAPAETLAEDHSEAIRLNKARVDIKLAIDAACRASYTDIKGYYDRQKPTASDSGDLHS
jgi:hypothetical protein